MTVQVDFVGLEENQSDFMAMCFWNNINTVKRILDRQLKTSSKQSICSHNVDTLIGIATKHIIRMNNFS